MTPPLRRLADGPATMSVLRNPLEGLARGYADPTPSFNVNQSEADPPRTNMID